MNRYVDFMLCLRRVVLKLNDDKKEIYALMMKELLIKNSDFLPENCTAIDFIDEVFLLCEEFDVSSLCGFYFTACDFYSMMLDQKAMDVFFIGNKHNFEGLKTRLDSPRKNIELYNADNEIDIECLSEKIASSPLSVLVYDHQGSQLVFNKGMCRPFAHIYYGEVSSSPKKYDVWGGFLLYQFKRFARYKFELVILGSSYSYHTLTDVNSVNSVSFSLRGLDITSAKLIFDELNKIHLSEKNILCFGLYDLFKEIKKGNAPDYVNANKAVMIFKNSLSAEFDSEMQSVVSMMTPVDIKKSIDSIIEERYFTAGLSSGEYNLSKKDIECKYINNLQKSVNLLERVSTSEGEIKGAHVANLHSKYTKYEHSFEVNCKLLLDCKDNAERQRKSVFFIIPPLPKSYIENLSETLVDKSYSFLCELESQYFHVIDLSSEPEFEYSDFADGHHLNISGAKKLQNKLYQLGILNMAVL